MMINNIKSTEEKLSMIKATVKKWMDAEQLKLNNYKTV